ncbi:hypothetical protein [Alishewanella phage vB_AspM_Slickus01]|nr:hypothetical protein [Alishewanella phage vB_AspM_Slickus01]
MKDLEKTIQRKVAQAITERCKLRGNTRQPNKSYTTVNESLLGSLKGGTAGTIAAIAQMAGGSMVFMSGSPISGTLLFGSSIFTGMVVGNLVKKNHEFNVLKKLDEKLAKNVSERDNLFKAYAQAASLGLVNDRQYNTKANALTKEQQMIGIKMEKHVMSTKEMFTNTLSPKSFDMLMELIDVAKNGSLTNVDSLAKYRLNI